MLSKIKKFIKFLPQAFITMGALSIAFAMLLSVVHIPVKADSGCPVPGSSEDGGIWDKTGSITSTSWEYNLPEGKAASKYCFHVSGETYSGSFSPPKTTVSFTSLDYNPPDSNNFIINWVMLLVVDLVPPTATPTNVPPTATPTDVPPTATPTDVPPTATPTDVPPTATPTEVPPTATPTDVPPTATPTDLPPTATPTDVPPTTTPGDPTATPTDVPPTETPTDVPPTSTPTDVSATATPPSDETPVPTQQPTLPAPVTTSTPAVLIPVTGSEIASNSPFGQFQEAMFNLGLGFLGIGLVLQSIRKKINL